MRFPRHALPPPRDVAVLVHRYVGLALAGFLLLAGLTGSLLAWFDELEALVSPQLFVAIAPVGARPLDPLLLRERVLARFPGLELPYAPLHIDAGRTVAYSIKRRPLAADGMPGDDQAFINPYTGVIQGTRKYGDLSQGVKNLMPFIYRLHTSLALGVVGTYTFGIVSLCWTLDCFIGAWLTFPPRARKDGGTPWRQRWWPSWKVRWNAGAYKLNVDLHRAGGLWPWALLLVLAWSGVAFNLKQVYEPVMGMVFARQQGSDAQPAAARPQARPGLDWPNAREVGRRLMARQAAQLGFVIEGEDSLVYSAARVVFIYDVKSSIDLARVNGVTRVIFDANTGAYRGRWMPTGVAAGDTIRSWITLLHRAAAGGALGGWPLQLAVCALGVLVAMLSVTGLVIWLRKRRGRVAASRYNASSIHPKRRA